MFSTTLSKHLSHLLHILLYTWNSIACSLRANSTLKRSRLVPLSVRLLTISIDWRWSRLCDLIAGAHRHSCATTWRQQMKKMSFSSFFFLLKCNYFYFDLFFSDSYNYFLLFRFNATFNSCVVTISPLLLTSECLIVYRLTTHNLKNTSQNHTCDCNLCCSSHASLLPAPLWMQSHVQCTTWPDRHPLTDIDSPVAIASTHASRQRDRHRVNVIRERDRQRDFLILNNRFQK